MSNRSCASETAFLSTVAVDNSRSRSLLSWRPTCPFTPSFHSNSLSKPFYHRTKLRNPLTMSTQMPEIPEINLPEPALPTQQFDPKLGGETAVVTVEENEENSTELTWLESILSVRRDLESNSNNNVLHELRRISDEALKQSEIAQVARDEIDEKIKLRKQKLRKEYEEDILIDQDDINIFEGDEDDKRLANNLSFERNYPQNDGYLPLPNRKLESWRFTDLRSLYSARYKSSPTTSNGNGSPLDPSLHSQKLHVPDYVSKDAGIVLVFVDGIFSKELSQLDRNDDYQNLIKSNGFIGHVADYKGDSTKVTKMLTQAELGNNIKLGAGLFPVVGNAITSDIAIVDVPEEFSFEGPVVTCFISTTDSSSSSAFASAPRLFFLGGSRSSTTLVEYYISSESSPESALDSTSQQTNSSIFSGSAIQVNENAKLFHFIVNYVNETSTFIGTLHSTVHENGEYNLRYIGLGGSLGRLSAGIDLLGDSSIASIKGLSCADKNSTQDFHSRVNHISAHTRCQQMQKNIATGKGRVVFCGKIIVEETSSDTDSQQLSKSLVLSEGASVDAMPVLEISNDDVVCTHGATVSDLSEDELFYCRSRGLSHKQAQSLLILGFVGEVLGDCPMSSVPELIRGRVEQISEASRERSTEGTKFLSL